MNIEEDEDQCYRGNMETTGTAEIEVTEDHQQEDIDNNGYVSTDSEEEPIVKCKKKLIKKSIIDSDEDSNNPSNTVADNSSDEEIEGGPVRFQKRKKVLINSEDSDSDDDNEMGKHIIEDNTGVEENGNTEDTSDKDTEERTTEISKSSQQKKIIPNEKVLDELFDADGSSSDSEKEGENLKHVDEGYHGDQGESEEDEAISDALRRKLAKAKGAAKKPKSTKLSEKGRREEKQQIHSDSQRIMREREVRMPYHEPKKVGLSVFLARTQQKHEALKKFTPGSWKNTPDLSLVNKSKNSPENSISTKKSKLKEAIEKRIEYSKAKENLSSVDLNEESKGNIVNKAKKQLDLDDLPDLINTKGASESNDTENTKMDNHQIVNGLKTSKVLQLPENRKMFIIANEEAQEQMDTDLSETQKTHSESLDIDKNVVLNDNVSKKCDSEKPEQDSGYLTTPLNSSEEESNGTNLNHEDNSENNLNHKFTSSCNRIIDENSHLSSVDLCINVNNAKSEVDINRETVISDSEIDNCALECTGVTDNSQEEDISSKGSVFAKKKLTPKLASLGVTLPPAPRLSGGPDSFIDLSDEDKTPQPPSGVQKLMERLMKHSNKRSGKKAHDVEISTIVKDKDEDDSKKQELRVDKFIYHVEGEEEEHTELSKPGAKLLKLKEALKEKMAAEREKARQIRNELQEMENEEGFEDEEEAELTDESESEIDEEEYNEEEELEDMDEYTEKEKKAKEANPFVDDEAEDEDDNDDIEEEGLHLQFDTQDSQDENSCVKEAKSKNFLEKAINKTKSVDLFDEEANTESPTMSQKSNPETVDISERPFEQLSQGSKPLAEDMDSQLAPTQTLNLDDKDQSNTCQSLFKDSSFNNSLECQDSSFELIPAGQRTGRKSRLDDSPSSKSSILSSKKSSLSLPVENSQDLFSMGPSNFPTQESKPHSSNLHFSLDDSESNLMNDEKSNKKPPRRQLLMSDKDSTDDVDELLGLCSGQFNEDKPSKALFETDDPGIDNTQELLGLCSGRFTGQEGTSDFQEGKTAIVRQSTGNFEVAEGPVIPDTQGNMDELLGLCSGQFTSINNESSQANTENVDSPVKLKSKKRKIVIEDDSDQEDEYEVGSHEGNDEDEQESAENLSSGDEEEIVKKEKRNTFTGLVTKKKKLRQEFVEDEAELSGSEEESDEDFDLGDEEDILEAEEGDNDDLKMSEEELRNQVGRVHLKSVIDSDKRQIRLMQEMYLQDGDLYSEGGGRQRKFRWRNIDDDTQDDLFNNASDEEIVEDEVELEKWRVERHEREKFLKEQMEKDFVDGKTEDTSQPIKLGKVCFKPKKAKSVTIENQLRPTENIQPEKKLTPSTPPGLFKVPALKKKAGSFLGRSSDALAKIADMQKSVGNINGPRSNARGSFVFSSLSEEEKQNQEEERKTQVKRSNSTPKQSVAKRPRLERTNSLPKDSIFNLLH